MKFLKSNFTNAHLKKYQSRSYMNKLQFTILYILIFILSSNINCMIDNKYLPLYRPDYNRYPCKKSVIDSNIFFLIAGKAKSNNDSPCHIPEINGQFDLLNISRALEITGKTNPLSPQWRSLSKIPFEIRGKIEGQGAWFGYEQAFGDLSLGLSVYLFKIVSKQFFRLQKRTIADLHLEKGGEIKLRQEQLEANRLLGINQLQFSKGGFSDLDLYARYGVVKEYTHKFRKVDASITLGGLFPTGVRKNIDIPASIPFGGNGHIGLYARTDIMLELKDNLIVGFWLEVLKRFSKRQIIRLPVARELQDFGALKASVDVDPGITVGFKPYVVLADIQDGVGFKAGFTLVNHDEDSICNAFNKLNMPARLDDIIENSGWRAEYANLRLMYDFSKAVHQREFTPLLYIDWDMPISVFGSHGVSQTNRVSLGFEINF